MLESIKLFDIGTIAYVQLNSHSLRCEMGRWGKSDEMGGLCTLYLNKFGSLSITLWYNALPLIIFDCVSCTFSTKPNPYSNFSQSHCVHPWLQHSLVKFLNIERHYIERHFRMYVIFFGLIGHIWTLKMILKSVCVHALYVYIICKYLILACYIKRAHFTLDLRLISLFLYSWWFLPLGSATIWDHRHFLIERIY